MKKNEVGDCVGGKARVQSTDSEDEEPKRCPGPPQGKPMLSSKTKDFDTSFVVDGTMTRPERSQSFALFTVIVLFVAAHVVFCRKACTMWEFSYLVRRTPPEAEYLDWGLVLDQLVKRGYDCIRIDAFPHLIHHALNADRNSEKKEMNFTILPQQPQFMWGNHHPVVVDVVAGVSSFLQLAKDRNLTIGLSTWLLEDSLAIRDEIRSPQSLFEIWNSTLSFFRSLHLLENGFIEWVDLLNEFPVGEWAPGIWKDVFGVDYTFDETILLDAPWPNSTKMKMSRYFAEVIPPLKKEFPELRFLFSFQSMGSDQMVLLPGVEYLDAAEVHIWIMDDFKVMVESLQVLLLTNEPRYPLCLEIFRDFVVSEWFPKHQNEIGKILLQRLGFWSDFRHRMLQKKPDFRIFTTEAWGPINYLSETQPDWEWVRIVSEIGVELAIDIFDWDGLCSSNYCEPHFSFWENVPWHQSIATRIRG